jgi:hypothetical protein
MDLTPAQEHYLKRELLRLQSDDEIAQFNDPMALRHFGSPFTPSDPRTFEGSMAMDNSVSSEFPLCRYFFTHFLITVPFLSADHQDLTQFWVKKVQVFFEHFMSMSMSETMDREEETKRKKMALRLQRLILMIYNSGIGTVNELEYYNKEKLEITGGAVESKRMQKLLFPSKDTLKDHLSKGVFVNGISLNISGVRKVKKSNNKFLSGLNLTKTHETHFEFLITTQLELNEAEKVIVSRRYKEFKDLHHKLKKKFPGKHLPKLPSKVKSMISLGSDEPEADEEIEDLDEEEQQEELEQEKLAKQHDEEIRQNLSNLFKGLKFDSPQAPRTPVPQSNGKFDSPTSPDSPRKTAKSLLSPKRWNQKKVESENKLPREKTRVGLRAYLRELLKDIEVAHSDILKEFLFKGKLRHLTHDDEIDIQIRENLDLLLLLNQVKFQREAYSKITKLKENSLPLRAKLLESDKGIVEIFDEFRTKEHISELSPMLRNFFDWSKVEIAATIYQVFLGNDGSYELYSQVRRLHKLMPYSIMINILKFTNPMSIMKTMIDLLMANPFGGKSLLQTLFYGILSDDMKSQGRVIEELETKIGYKEIIRRFRFFVYECTDYDLIESIKYESKEMETDVVLTVMISPKLYELSEISDDLVGSVFESYNEYKKLKIYEDDPEQLAFVNHETLELYSDLRTLYKLYVRNRDKEIMQQLWSEPELTAILRELFTMFYQPLVNLFSNAHIDVAVKNFESFMDDLISVVDKLTHDMYTSDTTKIVDDIMGVLNDHEDEFYQFVHDTYINDKQGIFDKLVRWINDILVFLRNAKNIDNTNQLRIDFQQMFQNLDVDESGIMDELDAIIESVKRRHEEYNKKLSKQAAKNLNLVDENWDMINNVEVFKSSDFGLNDHDIEDLEGENDGESLRTRQEEVKKTDCIKELLPEFKKQLIGVLSSYDN